MLLHRSLALPVELERVRLASAEKGRADIDRRELKLTLPSFPALLFRFSQVGDGAKNLQVGDLIAIVGEEGDDFSGADAMIAEHNSSGGSKDKEASKEAPKEEEVISKSESGSSKGSSASSSGPLDTPAGRTAVGTPETPAEAPKHPSKVGGATGGRIFATPVARRIAQEKGIPLGEVKGSGPEGRIIKEDVEKFVAAPAKKESAASSSKAAPAASSASASSEYTDVPVSSMRKTIGKRLLESTQSIPSFYVTVEVNMDKLIKLRSLFNAAGAEGKVKLSVNDFIVKATALALAEVPEANSAWMGDAIRTYKNADICVAVATPTGLITPIIKNAGAKGLASISSETKSLASKARDGKLKPEEYQGGSFTISNLGMFGVSDFTAIINPPQSCILAVGGTTEKVVKCKETGEFKETSVMSVTLTSDHRTVDGAVAAKFLQSFKGFVEQPLTFML